jgi:hypothetical protein
MKAGKKNSCPCVNAFLKSNSSTRSYKNGNLVSGYDTTYDSDDDTLDINTYGNMAAIPNEEFIRNMLYRRQGGHQSLINRLMSDFSVSSTPHDLYDAKKIGVSIIPIISSKYHPMFSQKGMAKKNDSKKKSKGRKVKKGKASRKHKK